MKRKGSMMLPFSCKNCKIKFKLLIKIDNYKKFRNKLKENNYVKKKSINNVYIIINFKKILIFDPGIIINYPFALIIPKSNILNIPV